MPQETLVATAQALVTRGKGLRAMDEGADAYNKRFAIWAYRRPRRHGATGENYPLRNRI